MRRFYNLIFTAGFIAAAPFYFFKMWRRGDWLAGFGQRFGRYSPKLKHALSNRHVIWFHAVSVGEVNTCTQLIRRLEPRAPNLKIVVSTTTSTGMAELHKRLPRHIEKIYYPLDLNRVVRRALATIHPEAVVLMEAEIWPNFLWRIQDRKIPLFLVNARLSERSYRGYKRFHSLFRPLFAGFSEVGAQNDADAQKLTGLGCRSESVHVVGNLKFDAARLDEKPLVDAATLLASLGVAPGAPVLVAGSTHDGEEAILAETFQRLRTRFPELFLVLVPRHFERGKEVGRQLEARKVPFVYRTEIGAFSQFKPGEVHCLLVNTTGELRYFYEAATVVFVGKSLTAKGGQNPIEPASLGKPLLFGPNMQNFSSVAATFLSQNAALQVANPIELEKSLAKLLDNPGLRKELGENAARVVRENLGSVDRTVELIIKHLREEETYIKPA